MKRALIVLVALVGCRADAESLPVEPPPPPPPAEVARSVKLERVATGLRMPVALTFAPGDAERRLFIVEKPGYVRVLQELIAASWVDKGRSFIADNALWLALALSAILIAAVFLRRRTR